MVTAVEKSVYPHITKNPKVMAGRACIQGTRIRVMDIASLHEAGYAPEKMLEEYPQLDLIQVYAALVYYHDHRAEIEACFTESQKWAASNDRERLEYLRRRSTR